MSLLEQVTRQQKQLSQLVDTLDQELHLIGTREPELLIELLRNKETLLNDIAQCDSEIENTYAQIAPDDIADDVMAGIAQCQLLLNKCKYLTEVNQTAVANGQLRVEHLRNTLNELRTKETMTYDRSGKTTGSSLGGSIKA